MSIPLKLEEYSIHYVAQFSSKQPVTLFWLRKSLTVSFDIPSFIASKISSIHSTSMFSVFLTKIPHP
jgi:hypothetical protein